MWSGDLDMASGTTVRRCTVSGGVSGSFQAQLAVWASTWSLQDVEDEISGKSTPIMERVRKETIFCHLAEAIVQCSVLYSSLYAGNLQRQ
jgi:hypothetical protein